MNQTLDLTAAPSFNLSFLIDSGITKWFQNGEKQDKSFISSSLKSKMPSNSLFDISSLVFNIRTHKQETFSKYTCYYQQDNDILCFILDEKAKRSHLTKEVMTNFMEFANKICVKAIIILLSNKNKEYYNLLMDLLTFGFVRDEKMPITTIENKQFKVLKMNISQVPEEIEEVEF